jgi:hypothetical protein
MSVKKMFGYKGGKISPVVRMAFIGDPASWKPEPFPKPITERGKRRSEETPAYLKNKQERAQQRAPAAHSIPAHKGPHHRPKGMSQRDWTDAMIKKIAFEY